MIAPDIPVAGYYALRLVRGGPFVSVRIWFGAPVIEGEELERSHGWRVEIDGRTDMVERDEETSYRCVVAMPVDKAWPYCARYPVRRAKYEFLKARAKWAKEHDPNHPAAAPRERVDLGRMQPIF